MGRHPPLVEECMSSLIVVQAAWYGLTFPTCCVRMYFNLIVVQAAWYGSTFPKMVKEYKSMLIRVQRQHGVERPVAPFTTKDMNDYIDTRRRELHWQLDSIGWEGCKGCRKQGAASASPTTSSSSFLIKYMTNYISMQ